jgi:hypothetical protein
VNKLTLSEEQLAAATTKSTRAMVIAGAGSGKTATIIGRYAHLLSMGVDPQYVVIVTFTVKAAAELKARITKAGLAEPEYVGTVHGWCVRYLPEGYAVAPEKVAKMAQEWVCDAMPGEAFPDPIEISAVDIESKSRVYKAYTAYLLRNGMYDFDMLLKLALSHLQVRQVDQHLIVDEYQDTGPVERLIYARFSQSQFIVGDPRQSLYGFRGAAEWDVLKMKAEGWGTYTLSTTYRCKAEIARRVSRIEFPGALDLFLLCGSLVPAYPGGTVTEGDGVVKWISDNLLLDATILCRSNREVGEIERELETAGLPVIKCAAPSETVEQYTDWLATKLSPDNDAIVGAFLRRWDPATHERAMGQAHKQMVGVAAVTAIDVRDSWAFDQTIMDMIQMYPDDLERLAALYHLRYTIGDGPGFRVMTVHQAKGLEWKNVCVVIPKWLKDDLDSRRILYVAMTRASERLHLATSHLKVVPAWLKA